MTAKKSFKDMIREAGEAASGKPEEKKRKREEDATRPQIAVPGTKEGLTEPPAGISAKDSTRQMTPLDQELALSQDRAAAMEEKREKGKWETSPTMQMEALTEQALLEQDKALAGADVRSAAPSPESALLDNILESGAVEEAEGVVVSIDAKDLDQPLDGVIAEPPTLTNEKAMTKEEAAEIAEPPTMSKEAMTEKEAAEIAEPPTMSKEAMTEKEAAEIAEPPTITEKEKVDDSILKEIEDDVFGAAKKPEEDIFAPLAETGEDVFSALEETEAPSVAEGSQSVAVEESYQMLSKKVEKAERESEQLSPAKTERKGWLSYYLSEVFLGVTSVVAAVAAVVYAGSLSVTMAAVLVGYMALSGTAAVLSAMGKHKARKQQDEVSRGVNDEY